MSFSAKLPKETPQTLWSSLKKNNSINSTFNGIAFTVDLLNDNPDKARLFALRSFGESLYHSITDACLEFGFVAK